MKGSYAAKEKGLISSEIPPTVIEMPIQEPQIYPKIDLLDLMKVLCCFREEAFPFERQIALITFSTWLHWPNNPKIVHQGRLIAGALFITAIFRGEIEIPGKRRYSTIDGITTALLSVDQVADCLIDRALDGSFKDWFDDALDKFNDVSTMVAFLVRCQDDRKPSVNKALFMISEGAFDDRDEEDPEDAKLLPYRPSQATLKKSWSEFASQGPFLFAAGYFDWEEIFELAPDNMASVSEATRLLKNAQRMRRFFGFARYVQELLFSRLERQSINKLEFVKFPEDIKPCRIKLRPLEDDQLEILKRYRAPKFLPEEPPPRAAG